MAKAKHKGKQLLSAVERIIESNDAIIAKVMRFRRLTERGKGMADEEFLERVAKRIVQHYSNRSAVTGGATAIPALLPGIGTALASLGGTLADMALMLKYEVEMALALSHLFGFDIEKKNERQLAYLLASVSTYEAKSGRPLPYDLVAVQGQAIWNYTPRELSKWLVTIMTKLALMSISKGFIRAFPVVGIVVGSTVNKALTKKVGERCIRELLHRRTLLDDDQIPPIIDAEYEE